MGFINTLDPRTPKWLKKALRKAMRERYFKEGSDWENMNDRGLHGYYLNQAIEQGHGLFADYIYIRECLDACRHIRLNAIKEGTW